MHLKLAQIQVHVIHTGVINTGIHALRIEVLPAAKLKDTSCASHMVIHVHSIYNQHMVVCLHLPASEHEYKSYTHASTHTLFLAKFYTIAA